MSGLTLLRVNLLIVFFGAFLIKTIMATGFWTEVWNEVRPICIHGACVSIAVAVALILGCVLPKLETLYPDDKVIFWWMRKGDLYTLLIAY